MDAAEKEKFRELITALAAAFGRDGDKALLLAYWIALRDLPLERVTVAVERALTASRFMPVPAELRELAGEESVRTRAVKAWQSVSDAAADVGSYRAVCFEDELINATVRNLGGWPELISRTGDDFDKWARKEFIDTYERLSAADLGDDELRSLPGLSTDGRQPVMVESKYGTEQIRRVSKVGSLEAISAGKTGTSQMAPKQLLHLRKVP